MSIIFPVSLEISSTISYLKHEESYFYYVVTQSNIGFGLSFSFASRHVPHIFCPLVCFSICSFFPLCFCLVGQNTYTRTDGNDDQQFISASSTPRPSYDDANEGVVPTHKRDCAIDFEPCSKLEDLNLDVGRNSGDEERHLIKNPSRREEFPNVPIHEVIFSTVDKPKLLSQLSALLSDIGLNIREAHVFSTTDGYSLDVFVVDGWHTEGSVLSPNVADFAMLWPGYRWFV
jgi:hypothetical protein